MYDTCIGDSDGEGQVDSFPEEFGDLVYENEAGESTEATVSSWVKNELVPKILDRCVRQIPNTPRPGVVFKDLVGSLLLQPFGLSLCCGMIADWLEETTNESTLSTVDAILSGDLGYVFAGALGGRLMKPVILARKPGKLQERVDRIQYRGSNIANLQREEGDDTTTLEVVSGSVQPGQRILIVDDCLASGSTGNGLIDYVKSQGGIVSKLACVMELPDLGARSRLLPHDVNCLSLLRYDGH